MSFADTFLLSLENLSEWETVPFLEARGASSTLQEWLAEYDWNHPQYDPADVYSVQFQNGFSQPP